MKRRALLTALAGAPVLAAVGAAKAAPAASTVTVDEATRILLHNVVLRGSPATSERFARLIAEINLGVHNRLLQKGLIDPKYVMTGPITTFGEHEVAAKTRKLATRVNLAFDGDESNAEPVWSAVAQAAAEGIALEFEAEFNHPSNKNLQFCPYVLATSPGVLIDPTTFDPVTAFMTRYGTFKRT